MKSDANCDSTSSITEYIKPEVLKGQYHQDLVVLENPMKVLVLIGNSLIVAWPACMYWSRKFFKTGMVTDR